ncbi:MAG: MFS transporter [Blautia producta]
MVADTIEYGQWKTGKRVEGMLYSSTTFGAKIGAGVGMAVSMGILGAADMLEQQLYRQKALCQLLQAYICMHRFPL